MLFPTASHEPTDYEWTVVKQHTTDKIEQHFLINSLEHWLKFGVNFSLKL